MKGITPRKIEKYLPWMVQILPKYGVDTPLRLSHYLSQIGHENKNFSAYRENLNYSEEGLLKTFKSDFDVNKDRILSSVEKAFAETIAKKPILIGTGRLRRAVSNSKKIATWNLVRLEVNLPYAANQNEGITLPQRQYMGDSATLRKKQRALIIKTVDRIWQA